MAKERLSKLQKWILQKCLYDLFITGKRTKEFFGHENTKKPGFSITNCERVILFRGLNNLLKKDLLYQREGWRVYCLTEAGFLKANSFSAGATFVSFKDYNEAIEKKNEERNRYWEVLKTSLSGFKRYRGRRRKTL